MTTIRTFLAIAYVIKWPIYQFDINNAPRHMDLPEKVYMELPNGQSTFGSV